MKRTPLSTIIAPVVEENARRAALAGPKAPEQRRPYTALDVQRFPSGEPVVASYDAN